jgi:hypothetical protein
MAGKMRCGQHPQKGKICGPSIASGNRSDKITRVGGVFSEPCCNCASVGVARYAIAARLGIVAKPMRD